MNPFDLAAIFNGLPISEQVDFLSAIKPNAFLVADEITYNLSSNQKEETVLNALAEIGGLLLEYHLNFGTNRLAEGKYKDEAVKLVINDADDISGIFFDGFFFSEDTEPFKAIDWARVEVGA